MDMRVTQAADGTWQVETAAGVVLASGMTNSQAWRWVDRVNSEPITKTETWSDPEMEGW
jgi:hypothetical protein